MLNGPLDSRFKIAVCVYSGVNWHLTAQFLQHSVKHAQFWFTVLYQAAKSVQVTDRSGPPHLHARSYIHTVLEQGGHHPDPD